MKTLTRAAAALALVLPLGLATAAPASAAPAPGAACAQAGIATLKEPGPAAGRREQAGRLLHAGRPGRPARSSPTCPTGSYLSLGAVVKLHHTNPELFAWCR